MGLKANTGVVASNGKFHDEIVAAVGTVVGNKFDGKL